MIGRTLVVAGVVLAAGIALTGCARHADAVVPAPASNTAARHAAPDATSSSSGDLDGIAADLGAADSATSNAGSDVAAADASAASSDNP